MSLTLPPEAPSRNNAPATYISRMNAFLAWIVTFVAEMNVVITNFSSAASSAEASAQNAAAAASSAASAPGAGDASWLSMDRGAIKYAIEQAALANAGVRSLNKINQQQGEITLYNYGTVSGCVVAKKGIGRLLSIAAGVCYLEGRKYYVPAQDSANAVPNGAAAQAVVYCYLELVSGIPTLKVSSIASPTPPVGTVMLRSITIPAIDAGGDLAACALSAQLCPVEPDYPNSVNTPVTQSVALLSVLPDTNYTVEFEVISSAGSPCDERSLKINTRNTNNFIVTLYSAADDVVVRWKLSRLNGIAEHPVNDWRARFAANPANINYPTSSAY